jgi:hypothetical protein
MADLMYCPHCSRSLKDMERFEVKELPDGTNLIVYPYSLITGYEDPYVYDGVLYWVDDEDNGGCGWAWMRWTEALAGYIMYEEALRQVAVRNESLLVREETGMKELEGQPSE